MTATMTLLLVDDEPMIREMLEEDLAAAGFDTLAAANGREAMAILDACWNDIVGLVTDIRLGQGPNGWDVARHARALSSTMPIVYMTGDSAWELDVQGVAYSLLVNKPLAAAQIVSAITSLLQRRDSAEHDHKPRPSQFA
ncbi:response regulator [Sphingomonas pruni]|uniref:response regulator n=1 Tax=Sphingomonas pruni TaxID=40683 RepID=UPI000A06AEE9|nr:response regulator [Sphingomonas pruni]